MTFMRALISSREVRDAGFPEPGETTTMSPGLPGLSRGATAEGLTVPAWWAGVRIISETVAMVPCEILLRTDEDVVTRERKHRLWTMLGVSANAENSAGQVWEFVTLSLLLRGNAYLWKERDRDGRVIALWPIRPGRVFVGRDPKTRRKIYAISTSTDDADPTPVSTADILHIRGPGYDPLVGWSPLRFQRDLLQRSLGESSYQRSLLDNGAKLSGFLSTDSKLTDEAAAKLARRFQGAYSGAGNAGKTPVLEEGMSFHQLSMSAADAQFLQQRQFTRQEIAMILRLPAHMLLAGEGGGLHYSSAQMDTKAFAQNAIAPWCSRIERALLQDRDLPWNFTGTSAGHLFPRFNIDALASADPTARYENYALARNAGWMVANEIRAMEGMPPVPGGDVLKSPTTTKTPKAPEGPTE